MNNPFHYGKPISPEDFIVPNKARLQAIVRQIITGESTAIVGEPHYGKTSLLKYLYSPAIRDGICSLQKEWRLVFQLMDYDLFQANDSGPAIFWEHALAPVGQLAGEAGNPQVKDAYERCVTGKYNSFAVEKLFSALEENKIRLVLMIDEFDDILQHPILGKKEFLGTLRSLGTWKASFALIITTRSTVDELNDHPQENDTIRRNSPYFNYFHQFILGPFTLESTRKLLKRADGAFTPQEELILVRLSDHNPHFLQMAAHALWDAYFAEQIAESVDRMEYVWKHLGKESASTLDDAWKHWTLRTKEVLTIVALDDLPRLIAIRGYDTRAFAEQLRDCTEEIDFLEDRGYITKSEGKYVISSQVLASWLSKKITASFQNQDQFGKWLMANQPKRVLSEAQRDGLRNILVAFGGVLRQNSDLFIKVMLEHFFPMPH